MEVVKGVKPQTYIMYVLLATNAKTGDMTKWQNCRIFKFGFLDLCS